jgi:hypothetical protein
MLLITSHFILWLLQTSCSIFIDVACYNHSRVFYACCTISMHITDILVVMLKSAILLPKNSMCPILPLNKNYLRNYLEPKNYLEVPEWQDDSWSGNCWSNSSGRLLKPKTPVEIMHIQCPLSCHTLANLWLSGRNDPIAVLTFLCGSSNSFLSLLGDFC